MRKTWHPILTLFGLYYLSHFIFELVGKPFTDPPLNTVEDLLREFDGKLSDNFYWGFEQAVEWQTHGNPNKARAMYEVLMDASQRYDSDVCLGVQEFINYNMRLLP
jgi:hypothetical protein